MIWVKVTKKYQGAHRFEKIFGFVGNVDNVDY